VSFELDAQLDYVMECSCSLCRRVGALWHGASDASLRITAGEAELTLYQFNTMTARHYACRHCGVHPFSRPRLEPSRWAVNVRCIDGVDLSSLPLMRFDGAKLGGGSGGTACEASSGRMRPELLLSADVRSRHVADATPGLSRR
jgi:hypothetical protein